MIVFGEGTFCSTMIKLQSLFCLTVIDLFERHKERKGGVEREEKGSSIS